MAALNKRDMDTNAHDLDYEPNFSHSRALTVNDVDLAEALAAKLLCHCASSRAIAVQQDDLGALLYLFEGSHLKAESMQALAFQILTQFLIHPQHRAVICKLM